ncbi:hypothetical protein CI109_104836 [Kwoniella shandongensis]|uniref:Uncharacterized protein n=1 Tax=Kwoniella shandongensis TaxID=1734106 RepID=A0A5M6BRG8_9TREE|nr:uncharacterized protein CI109_006179 [Kwoniella shandongensis]KAA5525488.1 hypothetical protein CI109_006179 [Kwoniella shandongensis]
MSSLTLQDPTTSLLAPGAPVAPSNTPITAVSSESVIADGSPLVTTTPDAATKPTAIATPASNPPTPITTGSPIEELDVPYVTKEADGSISWLPQVVDSSGQASVSSSSGPSLSNSQATSGPPASRQVLFLPLYDGLCLFGFPYYSSPITLSAAGSISSSQAHPSSSTRVVVITDSGSATVTSSLQDISLANEYSSTGTISSTSATISRLLPTAIASASSGILNGKLTPTATPLTLALNTTSSSTTRITTDRGLGVVAEDISTSSLASLYHNSSASSSATRSSVNSVSLTDISNAATITSTATASSHSTAETTFVSNGVTLSGQAAVAALAAAQSSSVSDASSAAASSGSTSEEQKSGLSSIAIVGIVGGVLVALIMLYLIWSQWRKKRARKTLGEEIPDGDNDEKRIRDSFDDYDNRMTRSSFGAEIPITPLSQRRRRPRDTYVDEYGNTMYDPTQTYYSDNRAQTGYYTEGDYDEGRTEYGLTQYGDGMTAALADGMATGIAGQDENPFVPVPPVPRVPSTYAINKHDTMRASAPVPVQSQYGGDGRETGYGGSIYDVYGGSGGESRPQTQFSETEPSTSNLLPWLNRGGQMPPPPVPPLPEGQDHLRALEPARAPPRAVMAQTPMGAVPMGYGGELDEAPIPAFR